MGLAEVRERTSRATPAARSYRATLGPFRRSERRPVAISWAQDFDAMARRTCPELSDARRLSDLP